MELVNIKNKNKIDNQFNMIIKTAEFSMSNTDVAKCPKTGLPEFAFIGRSNVGKSSLINMLVNHKSLAKTSAQPGKTQLINHFLINKNWYLVDLPGYGYARVSQQKREIWSKFIKDYVLKRQTLQCLFILIDSRLEPQKIDIEFITEIGEAQIPFALVFTKTDKLSALQLSQNIETFMKEIGEIFEPLPNYFKTSSEKKLGKDEVLHFIEDILNIMKDKHKKNE